MLELVNAIIAEDWHMLKTMKEQGMSISEIARRTGVSRKTVRKYIAMEKPAKYSREGGQSIIPPYTDYVKGNIYKHYIKRSGKKVIPGHTQLSRSCAGFCAMIEAYRQYTTTKQILENNRRWISGSSATLIWTGEKETLCLLQYTSMKKSSITHIPWHPPYLSFLHCRFSFASLLLNVPVIHYRSGY